ncbi:hypothetical protein EYF80_008718 [Liparis tanakae]|uniref:Uncharacterized protein n=1 Tax=Liparis tanakae TaxID=230148 RepID=A0A4Z2IUU0_9TELE|nr:hypothetical protein EYF80_008718 [Liparis tanakae]
MYCSEAAGSYAAVKTHSELSKLDTVELYHSALSSSSCTPDPTPPSPPPPPPRSRLSFSISMATWWYGCLRLRVALCKARVAKLALVGFLPGVDPLVALELTGLPEALGADGAHKVPLACVDVLVAGAFEGFAALLANVRLLLRVRDGVALEVGEVKEDPRAQLAVHHPAGRHGVGRALWRERIQRVEMIGGENGPDGRGGRSSRAGEVKMVVQSYGFASRFEIRRTDLRMKACAAAVVLTSGRGRTDGQRGEDGGHIGRSRQEVGGVGGAQSDDRVAQRGQRGCRLADLTGGQREGDGGRGRRDLGQLTGRRVEDGDGGGGRGRVTGERGYGRKEEKHWVGSTLSH